MTIQISKAPFPEGALDPQVEQHYAGGRFASPIGKVPMEKVRAAVNTIYNDREVLVKLPRVEDRAIIVPPREGKEGLEEAREIPVRIYQPDSRTGKPLLLYFHGGGFVMHNIASHDNLCRRLAKECGAAVVSVEYRLAPEHPFPAALQDAWEALCWAEKNAEELGADPARIFAGGDSAGATISASLAFLSRDRKGPRLAGQILYYGVFGAVPVESSKTVAAYGNGNYVLPKEMLLACDSFYRGTAAEGEREERREGSELLRYLEPGKVENLLLSDTRTLLVTGEFDPLREDGEVFAGMLSEAGSEVTALRMRGMMHGFLLLWPEFDRCDEVFRLTAEWMKETVADSEEPGAIFDMDGLLFDTERIFQETWHELAKERGVCLPENFKDLICGSKGEVTMRILREYYQTEDPLSVEQECIRRMKKKLEKSVPLKPGVFDILNYFRDRGIPMALASSSDREQIASNLLLSGTGSYFSRILCGTDAKRGKPSPDIFLLAAARLGKKPENCYVFEDSLNGIRAGHAAGCRTVMIPDIIEPTEEIRPLCAGIYQSLTEAAKALRRGEI